MQTVSKKKKTKTTKKHKRHQIDQKADTFDEQITKTSVNEQSFIEHKTTATTTSETHEQITHEQTVSLETAHEHAETFVFDQKTIPMETENSPKPIEILPLFHATNTQAVCIVENETQIHAQDSQKQKCSINISECNPIVVSEIEQIETIGPSEPNRVEASVHLPSTIITSLATINDQVIACDNFDTFEAKLLPDKVVAEPGSVPHLSKTIYEHVVQQKTDILPEMHAQDLKQAHEIFSPQIPIEIQEANFGETEINIMDKTNPTTQTAMCTIVSNTSLNMHETVAQSTSMKFYPETFIATEQATTKYVEQFGYQTQEICTSETEKMLDLPAIPGEKQAHVEFSKLQAITMEQTETIENETVSSYSYAADITATAKDTFDLHKEMQTSLVQAIDSVEPSESMTFSTKKASFLVEEMGSNVVETVNVFHSEKPLTIEKAIAEPEITPSYTTQEGFNVSEVFVQESDIDFSSVPQALATASETHELYKIIQQSDEQTFDVIDEYRQKQIEQTFNAQINFELQKSTLNETVIAHEMTEKSHDTTIQGMQPKYYLTDDINKSIIVSEMQIIDSEQTFETNQQQNQPKYDVIESVNKSIVVSETQINDSETSLDIHPVDVKYLNITDSPEQLSHVGTVFETIPYDSTELMQTNLEKGVSATEKSIVHHEVIVGISNTSENVTQLETKVLSEQKTATSSVITKNAFEIAMEQSAEMLDKLNLIIPEEHQPKIKHDVVILNPINVVETEVSEHSTFFDADTFETASSNVSTIEYKAKHIDERWSFEMSQDFNEIAKATEQKLTHSLVEETPALETFTTIPAETIEEFEGRLEKPVRPKIALNELSGICAEDIIYQEIAAENDFKLAQDSEMGQIIHDIEEQHRCEHLEQCTFESTEMLESMKNTPIFASNTQNMADALKTANVEETITNLSESAFETEQPIQHHGKMHREHFSVVGQTLQNIPLEKEDELIDEMRTIELRPKASIEKHECYDTSEVEFFEKETELKVQEMNVEHRIKKTTSQMLSTASTLENIALDNVEFDLIDKKDERSQTAVSKIDTFFEGIRLQDVTIHEMPSEVNAIESKSTTAKSSVESMKSVQVETIKAFEREIEFVNTVNEYQGGKQKLEEYPIAVISEMTQPIDQTGNHAEFKVNAKTARKLAEKVDEHMIFESVYLESQNDKHEFTHITNESTAHAIDVIQQIPLYKENAMDDNQTNELLIKPIVTTQKQTEFEIAHKGSDLNEFVYIKTNKQADVITNKKHIKKAKVKAKTEEVEGRWSNLIIYFISGI